TAKPRASMEFDDSDQVRLGAAPKAQNEKKADEALPLNGRNVRQLPAPAQSVVQASEGSPATSKTKAQAGADFAYAGKVAEQQAPGSNPTGVIGGIVVDASGAVIGNARITMVGPVGSKTASSDQQGNFMFTSLAPGSYSIKAEANGFKSSEITNVAVLDNKQ